MTMEPLEPALDSLLDAERGSKAPEPALERVWSRLDVSLPGAPVPRIAGSSTLRRWLATHAGKVAVASFVAGGASGVGLYRAAEAPRPERIVYVERPSAVTPLPPASSPAPPPVPEPASKVVEPAPLPRVAPAPSASLAAERAVIDEARQGLASGDASRALGLLRDHARRFAHPQLAEERDALSIQALIALGRYEDARSAGARFKAASPGSLFLPAVEASLASIP